MNSPAPRSVDDGIDRSDEVAAVNAVDEVDAIVNAVLYEGFILYPYRAATTKNRQRFTFGRVYPEAYSRLANGVEPASIQTECLIRSPGGLDPAEVQIEARFLHLIDRRVDRTAGIPGDGGEGQVYEPVESLTVDGKTFHSWQECIERRITAPPLPIREPFRTIEQPFSFPDSEEIEPLQDAAGTTRGVIVRSQAAVIGSLEVEAREAAEGIYRITARLRNRSDLERAEAPDAVLMRTFASAHIVLRAVRGEFVSLLEFPPEIASLAAGCANVGVWPVLVGAPGDRSVMLASPIILYDYPEIAPESPGQLFDGTEIDEILSLRILTLTDDEKRAMRELSDFTRSILERTETLPEEGWMRMHGTLREVPPKKDAP